MRVFIGHDSREQAAYRVAEASLRKHAKGHLDVIPLNMDLLRTQHLMWRKMIQKDGKIWDCVSHAFCSTEFAISRFFVPLLSHSGWSLFVDCDVVFHTDVAELFALADDRYAVMCVQHQPQTGTAPKMDDQPQAAYPRKNWSSVMLMNADHAANKRLSLGLLNNLAGRDLHAFKWMHPEELGALPASWNWLVNVEPKPEHVDLSHFTLGGPWIPEWDGAPHDEIWTEASRCASTL